MNKYCVVTCIFNDYDLVREPLVIDNDCDYYLFTDNKNLTSDNWKIKNLRIHWHSNKLYIDGQYLCCYEHNTDIKRVCDDNNEGVIFNRPIIIDNF